MKGEKKSDVIFSFIPILRNINNKLLSPHLSSLNFGALGLSFHNDFLFKVKLDKKTLQIIYKFKRIWLNLLIIERNS